MPKYVAKQLARYSQPLPRRPQHWPYKPNLVNYGKNQMIFCTKKKASFLRKKQRNMFNKLTVATYFMRALFFLALALSTIASDQANLTQTSMKRVHQLLDYMAMHPKAVIRYYTSDMILNVHSDLSYLSAGKGRSRG